MALQDFATKVSQLEDYPRILIYSKEGAGKTHLAGTFPKPLILDFDGGAATFKKVCPDGVIFSIDKKDIASGKIKPYEDVSKLLSEASQRKGRFAAGKDWADIKTIVIDGWTALASALMYEMIAEPGEDVDMVEKMQMQQWGELKTKQESLMGKLKGLPMLVVITCWMEFRQTRSDTGVSTDVRQQTKDKQADDNMFVPIPNVPGSYRDSIRYECSEVYYLARDKSNMRQLYSQPYRKYLGKSKCEGDMPNPLANPNAKTLFPYLAKVYKLGVEKKAGTETTAEVIN